MEPKNLLYTPRIFLLDIDLFHALCYGRRTTVRGYADDLNLVSTSLKAPSYSPTDGVFVFDLYLLT